MTLLDQLTTASFVVIFSNMKADLLIKQRVVQTDRSFAELMLWRLPEPVSGSSHSFKYRLAWVVDNECVLRYDNEVGKGDHKHSDGLETAYRFTTPMQLLTDFWRDVDHWRQTHE